MSRAILMSGGGAPDVPSPSEPGGSWHIHSSNKVFRFADGSPVRYRGFSSFRLLDNWSRGEDIRPLLRVYEHCNIARVWPYVPWDVQGWDAPPNHRIIDFIKFMNDMGKKVELTLLTDDNPRRFPWAETLIDHLADAHLPNLLLEIGNEPLIHKNIPVERFYQRCIDSGYLWASGMYEQEAQEQNRLKGAYGCAHTPRTQDFARRGHDLMEYWDGSGPDVRHVAAQFPWVGDEPIRPDEVVDPPDPAFGSKALQYRMYGGVCALLGAGATFHCASGRQALIPSDLEKSCLREMLTGLLAFPAEAATLGYNRVVEPGQHPQARTYVMGDKYMVRVWQTGGVPDGFTALDAEGILCVRR